MKDAIMRNIKNVDFALSQINKQFCTSICVCILENTMLSQQKKCGNKFSIVIEAFDGTDRASIAILYCAPRNLD